MTTQTWKAPVYFDLNAVESIAEEEAIVTLTYTPPVILPAEIKLKTNALLLAHEPDPADEVVAGKYTATNENMPNTTVSSATSVWVWLAGSLGLLLIFMMLENTFLLVAQQFEHSLLLGSVFLILVGVILSALAVVIWHNYQDLIALRTVSQLQEEGRLLREINGYGNALTYVNKITQLYVQRPDIKAHLDRFYVILNDSHHDRDVCHLYSTQVLKEIDQQAHRLVAKRSKETALLVMISQIALLDGVLTLWRNLVLIQDIAKVYGGRPSVLGSISLFGAVLQNLIYADVSEMVADSMAEILGGSMLSILSAQAMQGIGSGVMTARVGLYAMHACRPLPFADDEKPRLKDIRREIVMSLKKTFEGGKKEELRKTA
jgi:putative membrane protein